MPLSSPDLPLISLFWPFELERLRWPPQGGALFMRARDGWPLHQRAWPGLICDSEFKPDVDALERSGLPVNQSNQGEQSRHPLVMLLPPRQREQARACYVRALDRVAPGGMLIACQANDEGAKSSAADMAKLIGPLETLSKNHCRVFWSQPEISVDTSLAEQWRDLDAPRPILDGRFLSRPGVFAWDRIDTASRLLAENLPSDLAGDAADLGAGYGYLSTELLSRCGGIRRLHTFEADARALLLAENNLAKFSDRVELTHHWQDVTQGLSGSYDVIVCNPPFHTQQAGDRPDIGRRFIAVAARALRPGGRLWLVANRHLPYEAELDAGFSAVNSVCQRDGFKVIEARRAGSGQ